MKRLWKEVPPCMSDIMGFQAVLNHTGGVGIVDDSSHYKPLEHEKKGDYEGGRGHRGGKGHDDDGEKTNGLFKKGKLFSGVRIVSSEIEEKDAISGTAQKMMEAADLAMTQFHGKFALLTTAPCASMIGTELEEIADQITAKYDIPAAAVKLDGQKDYLYGISCTLEAMGKLLLKKQPKIPGTVNLLGTSTIDWSAEMLQETENWLAKAGFQVLSRWGTDETLENLQKAPAASVNLAVSAAGIRLARFMEKEFDIPYIAGMPAGSVSCGQLKKALHGEAEIPESGSSEESEILILGEQVLANAIRQELRSMGAANVRVCSFYEMDKSLMRPGDKKLVSEEELAGQLTSPSLRVVFGDPDYRLKCTGPVTWIPMCNQASIAPSVRIKPENLIENRLGDWLKQYREVIK